jgi:hypothetical protein
MDVVRRNCKKTLTGRVGQGVEIKKPAVAAAGVINKSN